MKRTVYIKAAAVGVLVVVLVVAYYLYVHAQGQALVNPSFEEGWHIQGRPEREVPDGWTLEFKEGSHPWCPTGPCHAPETKPNTEYVADGKYSMRTFTTFSHGLYGVWQEIDVLPGSWYEFTCKTRLDSNPPGELASYVGIQPWGGSIFDRQMVWGKETQVQREWQTVSVIAQAFGSRIKVSTGNNNKWATKDNTAWWDACTFKRVDPAPQPTPAPTYTPRPTYTPYPTPEPCPTCPPGGGCDYEAIRGIVREELDKTHLIGDQ